MQKLGIDQTMAWLFAIVGGLVVFSALYLLLREQPGRPDDLEPEDFGMIWDGGQPGRDSFAAPPLFGAGGSVV